MACAPSSAGTARGGSSLSVCWSVRWPWRGPMRGRRPRPRTRPPGWPRVCFSRHGMVCLSHKLESSPHACAATSVAFSRAASSATASRVVRPACGSLERSLSVDAVSGAVSSLSCFADAAVACRAASVTVIQGGVDTRVFEEVSVGPGMSCAVWDHHTMWFNNSAPEKHLDYRCSSARLDADRLLLQACTGQPGIGTVDLHYEAAPPAARWCDTSRCRGRRVNAQAWGQ